MTMITPTTQATAMAIMGTEPAVDPELDPEPPELEPVPEPALLVGLVPDDPALLPVFVVGDGCETLMMMMIQVSTNVWPKSWILQEV
ncbi:hypothetical protein VP1G_10538 [Cytospora mali]|uniref:Uncharacterized protein n=1 Tax=Cytospora mali TaxID=578113 RepID=A0A194UN07_CYTMA|nr:hypothetical protein VP1G_10538 [Valsa mali var. pyri (nom. inval.)]